MHTNIQFQHEIILIALILVVGGLAGFVNYLKEIADKREIDDGKSEGQESGVECIRYVLSGIGSAILVPLFLNMLSSNLIKNTGVFENTNYFVFAGFCFIAGYYSDRFIGTIGEKVLKELQETKDQIRSTKANLKNTAEALQKNEDKIDALVDNEAEIDDDLISNESKFAIVGRNIRNDDVELDNELIDVIDSFGTKFKFRTVTGIATELNYSKQKVELILQKLESKGFAKAIQTSKGSTLWTLTRSGRKAKLNNPTNEITGPESH